MSEKRLYEGDVTGTLMSKVAFNYDESGSIHGTDAPVQHDNTSYTASFVAGRGNLSSVKRYDVTNTAVFTTTSSKYNTAGAVVSSRDPSNHEALVSYTDSFSDNNNSRNTLAYPTTATDPDGYSSNSKYHFDFGAVTYVRTPEPNIITNTPGPEKTFTFDIIGRLQKIANLVNNAYIEFEYSSNNMRVDTYATIQEGLGEAHSFSIRDGAGQVIGKATQHPGSVGGYSGQKIVYDIMGRVHKTSNPTETSANGAPSQWTAVGDDEDAGWLYALQTYDWRGRPLITTNQDGGTNTITYTGCGCAGGEVVTIADPVNRRIRRHSDVLGREWKTEVLNLDGTVYATTVDAYDARDQVLSSKQYQGSATVDGSCPSGTCQQTTSTYDGYGRLSTQRLPEQAIGANTLFTYRADDTLWTETDSRGAVTSYNNNGRHLPTSIFL